MTFLFWLILTPFLVIGAISLFAGIAVGIAKATFVFAVGLAKLVVILAVIFTFLLLIS